MVSVTSSRTAGTEPAAGQLALQRLQEVLVAVLLDLHVGVAGDPEQVVRDDLQAGEELGQVRGDEVLERQERRRPAGRADRDEPRHVVGHLDPGEVARPVSGSRTDTARFSDSPLM